MCDYGKWGTFIRAIQFIATFVGMNDEEFNGETAPGGWTYRGIAKHLIDLDRDSLRTIHADIEQRMA